MTKQASTNTQRAERAKRRAELLAKAEKGQAAATTAKTDTKKADTKKAGTKKAEPKAIAKFPFFLEFSSCRAIPLSPDNAKIVTKSLEYFEAFNKELHNIKLTAEETKRLSATSEHTKATQSLLNRETMRLLITETDKDGKPVLQVLLKPVYLSPYAITCVTEAHSTPSAETAKKSKYASMINAYESKLTCYEPFNFNPLLESLTTSETDSKNTNKVTYQFVNIIATTREPEREPETTNPETASAPETTKKTTKKKATATKK